MDLLKSCLQIIMIYKMYTQRSSFIRATNVADIFKKTYIIKPQANKNHIIKTRAKIYYIKI